MLVYHLYILGIADILGHCLKIARKHLGLKSRFLIADQVLFVKEISFKQKPEGALDS